MKNRKKLMFLLSSVFVVSNNLLSAWEEHKEDPHYEWFEGDEVAVQEDGIYADSNKGMFKLNVVEYDRVNDRYKVVCSCLQKRGLDPAEALSVPHEDSSKRLSTYCFCQRGQRFFSKERFWRPEQA